MLVPIISYNLEKVSRDYYYGPERLWLGAFLINILTQIIPGRFDSQVAGKKPQIPWNTIFQPAGYAFAVWAVIYVGEILVTLAVSNLGIPSRNAVIYWTTANLFQSSWCLLFRPKYVEALWLPSIMIGLGALSLFGLHFEVTKAVANASNVARLFLQILRIPISVHAAWLTAAFLLNLNGWVTVSGLSISKQLYIARFTSLLAALIGMVSIIVSGDPFISATVIWTLKAISLEAKRYPNDITIDSKGNFMRDDDKNRFSRFISSLSNLVSLTLSGVMIAKALGANGLLEKLHESMYVHE